MEWVCVKCGRPAYMEALPSQRFCPGCASAAAHVELDASIRWARLGRSSERRTALGRLFRLGGRLR